MLATLIDVKGREDPALPIQPKNYWASLQPYKQGFCVHIPNIKTHIDCIPFQISKLLINQLICRTGYVPLGRWKELFSENSNLFIEKILKVNNDPSYSIKLALTLFLQEIIFDLLFNIFIKMNIFPQTPKDYQQSQLHLGCDLLKIPDLFP